MSFFPFVQMIQLVNRIIYRNIYNDPEERNSDTGQQPQASQSIRKGDLLLHRGGLASFKWVKYGCILLSLQCRGSAMMGQLLNKCANIDGDEH